MVYLNALPRSICASSGPPWGASQLSPDSQRIGTRGLRRSLSVRADPKHNDSANPPRPWSWSLLPSVGAAERRVSCDIHTHTPSQEKFYKLRTVSICCLNMVYNLVWA